MMKCSVSKNDEMFCVKNVEASQLCTTNYSYVASYLLYKAQTVISLGRFWCIKQLFGAFRVYWSVIGCVIVSNYLLLVYFMVNNNRKVFLLFKFKYQTISWRCA